MTKKIISALMFAQLVFSTPAFCDVTSQISINSNDTREVSLTEPSEWRIKLYHQQTKELLTKFDRLHTRDMHMVIVKKDLSSFAHVHPVLIGNTGVFHTILNQASFDPDNEQALHAVPSPGEYFVFSETSPKDRPELSVVELSRSEVFAAGDWQRVSFQLDPLDSNGGDHSHHGNFSITKHFRVEGLPDPEKPWKKTKEYKVLDGKYGDYFRTQLQVGMVPGCGGNMVKFHLGVETWDEKTAAYKPLKSFTPWLGMEAHAILLQADELSTEQIHFVHMHGMLHEEHNSLMFTHFDRQLMSGRNYRVWFQIKHNGRITTFPFSFHYMAKYQRECN